MSWFIDMGWGDWRLTELPDTRVTQAQIDAINKLTDIDTMGSSDVRFGEQTGPLIVFHTDGRITEVGEDGTTENLPEL